MSVDNALRRIRAKLADRVEQRAQRGKEIALDLHDNAPRSGANKNVWGEPRSAENEAPAIEYGDLYAAILGGLSVDKANLTAAFIVNWALLEYGTRVMGPRPMGRMTATYLKQEAQDG